MDHWKIVSHLAMAVFTLLAIYIVYVNWVVKSDKKEVKANRNKLRELHARFAGSNSASIIKYDVAGLFLEKHLPRTVRHLVFDDARHPLNPNFHSSIWYIPQYAVAKYNYLQVIKSDHDRFMRHLDFCVTQITTHMNADQSRMVINGTTYDISEFYILVEGYKGFRAYPKKLFSRLVKIAFHSYSNLLESQVKINHLEMFDHPKM